MSVAAIRLTPGDNVAVCCRTVEPGERIMVDGYELEITEQVALGHKLAVMPLRIGDKVIKYGMSIGSMTQGAPAGGWVHMHNMKSDYMPAHLRDASGDHS